MESKIDQTNLRIVSVCYVKVIPDDVMPYIHVLFSYGGFTSYIYVRLALRSYGGFTKLLVSGWPFLATVAIISYEKY